MHAYITCTIIWKPPLCENFEKHRVTKIITILDYKSRLVQYHILPLINVFPIELHILLIVKSI